MSWVANEVAGCRLKDQRLKPRLERILERLSAKPTASIPAACQGWGETQATYRFLSNERVEAAEILDGHGQATVQRIAAEPVVLLVQDTTFLEYLKDLVSKGIGTLRETSREEHLLHPSVAFTPTRVNLGVLHHQFRQRPEEPVGHLRAQRPIEEKESYRWLVGYEVACAVQRRCPETHVAVRSGQEGLGRWWQEERPLYADYQRFIGTPGKRDEVVDARVVQPPARIVRVWLIANTMFRQQEGQCEYGAIELQTGETVVTVN